MISFDEALSQIRNAAQPLGSERVALDLASARFLAQELVARGDTPRWPVSERDGYAIATSSLASDMEFRVVGRSLPGAHHIGAIGPGEAVRIFTGAALPDGTDRVIMQEYAQEHAGMVRFVDGHGPSAHVRAAASDFAAGEVLLTAGTCLTPAALVAAAAADQAHVAVCRRPRVALIATGDELACPGEAWRKGQAIPDTISAAIAAMVEKAGGEIVRRYLGGDELARLETEAKGAAAMADLVVVTGGASVGERDYAKAMFAPLGLSLRFERVAMRPGRPVWFGTVGGTHVLGLPGNPGSALVTARLFLVPLLERLQGGHGQLQWLHLPLAMELPPAGPRETFFRAIWNGEGLIAVANQASGAQADLARSHWLVRRHADSPSAQAGTLVEALAL